MKEPGAHDMLPRATRDERARQGFIAGGESGRATPFSANQR